jgi:hypothetical protein
VDERFTGAEQVRVIAPRPVDAAALARAYAEARTRFASWASARHGAAVELLPLTLVLASPDTVCAAVTRFSRAVAPDCAAAPPRFQYIPRAQTLYVLDERDPGAFARNLAEGAAQHVCAHTPALLEKGCMKNVLPPFWDEIEAGPR